jgi:hypothetical protein
MDLQEQISRTKELMGIQPLNEGIFRQKGKFKDLIKKIFSKGNSAEEIIQDVNPYEVKYGIRQGNSSVDGIILNKSYSKESSNGEQISERIFCKVGVITHEPQPLPEDPNKVVQYISYFLSYSADQVDTSIDSFRYFKALYLVDGSPTDELSSIRNNQGFICTTSTLEKTKISGEPLDTGCSLPQEYKDMILKSFESTKYYTQLQSYLDKLK